HMGEQQAITPLIAMLKDEDSYVRHRTCYALGDIGGISVFDPLVGALRDAEPNVRRAAVVNLGRIVGMDVPFLNQDSEAEKRHTVIESLKTMHAERILELLQIGK